MILGVLILLFVTLERVFELYLSRRNSRRLFARGALEHAPGHYPLIVALHIAWLATLWWLAPRMAVNGLLLAPFVLIELGRYWVVSSLGERWTTRIIVLPGEPLVDRGPYRLVAHPNYWIVAAEIAILPLIFGLWRVALIFSLLNGAILWVRIREENRALGKIQRG